MVSPQRAGSAQPVGSAAPEAVFVGLCTLDVIQSVEQVPGANDKIRSLRQTVAAGGPAANAAATCAALGGRTTLVTGIGRHPLAAGIRADLAALGIQLFDADAERTAPPTVSSIMVTAATGERAVVSTNAAHQDLVAPRALVDAAAVARVVLVDGHHMGMALAASALPGPAGRLVLFDGGSWKPRTDELLSRVDVAVCSANFAPPGTESVDDVLQFLFDHGAAFGAVSRGERSIVWRSRDGGGRGEVPVPKVDVVDTLGAGDVLHGALAYKLARLAPGPLDDDGFLGALAFAASVASRSCTAFGTRDWLTKLGRS